MIRGNRRPHQPVSAWLCTLALLLAGCGAEEQAPPPAEGSASTGTDELSRGLLEGSQAAPEGAGSLPPGRPLATPETQGQAAPQTIDIASLGYNAGESEAVVRVIEFSDFGCAFCRQFHLDTYPTIHEEYMETGKVEWKYIPVVIGRFGPTAELAADAGECAGEQGRFEPVRDRIFQLQSEWQRSPDPMGIFRGIMQEMGLDVGRWSQCVNEGWRTDRVRAGTQLGFQAGLQGTPTFLIVGFTAIPGAAPIELFREALDSALVLQGGGASPGH